MSFEADVAALTVQSEQIRVRYQEQRARVHALVTKIEQIDALVAGGVGGERVAARNARNDTWRTLVDARLDLLEIRDELFQKQIEAASLGIDVLARRRR